MHFTDTYFTLLTDNRIAYVRLNLNCDHSTFSDQIVQNILDAFLLSLFYKITAVK